MTSEAGLGLPLILFCLEVKLLGSEVLCLGAHGGRPKATAQTPSPLEEKFGRLSVGTWEPGNLVTWEPGNLET